MARANFALRMALAHVSRGHDKCPYCQSCLHQRLQRKWLLIEARKCAFCGLIFRYPTDTSEEASVFYERFYTERRLGDLPTAEELSRLRRTNFEGSPFDKKHRVELLRTVCPGSKVLDFGCSWGYGLSQLEAVGYATVGFELAEGMARYGRERLGVEIHTAWDSLESAHGQSFDLVYTDHVLEHVANLRQPLEKFARLLKPGGLLVIFVPNGGSLVGRRLGVGWKAFIGEAHTIAFTHHWFSLNLPQHGFAVETLTSALNRPDSLFDGEELACIARRGER